MSTRTRIEAIDRRLGSPIGNAYRRWRQAPAADTAVTLSGRLRFEASRERRRLKYRQFMEPQVSHHAVVADLVTEGVAKVPHAIALDKLEAVRSELERELDSGKNLNPAPVDARRAPGDLSESRDLLSADDLGRGQQHCRSLTNFLSVRQPFLTCPSTLILAFDGLVLDIATEYLGCLPAIGGGNLRKSFVNDLPDFDTLNFHSDPNSPKFLKFFFYLHDVGDGGGPFCYVRGSHKEKFPGWRQKYRWTPEEIDARYPTDRFVYMTAEAGDLVVANTTGFHRGTKVRTADRSMLTVDLVVHPEFGGRTEPPRIRRIDLERFDPRRRAAADLAEIVD